MKQLIGIVGDRIQAAFPPNRVAILLAGVITALSGTISAWLAAHAPGLHFGQVEIAGVLAAAVVITVRLLDRWFDQWQKGEPLTLDEGVSQVLDELHDVTDAFLTERGAVHAVKAELGSLEERITQGSINEAEIARGVSDLLDVVNHFIASSGVAADVGVPNSVEQPAPAAPPAAPAE